MPVRFVRAVAAKQRAAAVARRLFFLFALAGVCAAPSISRQAQTPNGSAAFLWIEGEESASLNVSGKPVTIGGWGHKEFLSGEKWLQISIDAANVDKDVPSEGVVVSYKLPNVPQTGAYQIWNRLGYEFVRSPFDWRMDDGPWKTVSPSELTTDLMELDTWNEVAWLKLGEQTLTAGNGHVLQIRLRKTTDDKGKPARLLYASDALCLTRGEFSPNGKYKPGEVEPQGDAPTPFVLVEPPSVNPSKEQLSIPLNGVWEICRADEQLPPFNIAVPMDAPPTQAHWKTIAVPADKNTARPDLLMAHRIWYRTRLTVPDVFPNRSFVLTFPQNNLNTTVYVNGVLCGFNKNPWARFDIDITRGIKKGQVNEIYVGIRDAWYGYSTSPTDPMKLRRKFNTPLSVVGTGFQDLAYPIWHGWQSGILATPVLTIAGTTYAADVFCKPSVANKEIAAEIILRNNEAHPVRALIECDAIRSGTGVTEKQFRSGFVTVPANSETVVNLREKWGNPALWWPDPNPNLYTLRAKVYADDAPSDIRDTPFGFREWGVSANGKDFTLNGVPWRLWADLNSGGNKEEWLKQYRASNQRMMRLMGVAQQGPRWMDLTPDQALDFFDKNGVVVRRCGPLDGEAIGYNAIENDPDLRKLYNSPIKVDLMQNWRDQMVAQVKGERNHPSVMLWSIENEWLYINCINLYGDKMDEFEREVTKTSDAVRAVDSTRLTMTDGGGANKDQSLPVHGNHYVQADFSRYPALAYETNPTGGGRGRWVWDEKRPRFIGEDFYATGINPADYATLGGEATFGGKAASRPATGLMYRILTEGYRWAGQSAWQFWLGADSATNQYNSQSPIALFCRQWDSAWPGGQSVARTLALFNDTHEARPLAATWTLVLNGKPAGTQTKTLTVAPGTKQVFEVSVPVPSVVSRQSGQWILTVSQSGKEMFRDARAVSILPGAGLSPPPASQVTGSPKGKGGLQNERSLQTARFTQKPQSTGSPFPSGEGVGGRGLSFIALYDPAQSVGPYLAAHKIAFASVASLDALPKNATVLLIGKDALTAEEAASSRLAAWASGGGRRVVVLEQKNPLRYQGLPAEMEAEKNEGRAAFPEDPDHPAFRGLQASDFFAWAGPARAEGSTAVGSEIVYRDAYAKPTRGGKSLVQCDKRLGSSALAEIPVGKNGLLIVSQLLVAEDLKTSPVARQMLSNLLDYAANYKETFRPVVVVQNGGGESDKLPGILRASGTTFQTKPAVLDALKTSGAIVAVAATPTNLRTLAQNKASVDAWTKRGGVLLLFGLTPEGLTDYNKLVGVPHLIRPFRRERVGFAVPKNPLLAGLSASDIALSSGERINNFNEDEYMAPDVFSYVVDYDEVAPFAEIGPASHWGLKDTTNDHDPYNIVNGFTNADSWKLTFMIWAGGGVPTDVPLAFPVPQTIEKFEWIGNTNYMPTTKVALQFDGQKEATFAMQPNGDAQQFSLPPGSVGKNILLKIVDWEKNGKTPLVGIDNIRLWAKRSPAFYARVKPMLTSGALMEYKQGAGGIVLCNVLFQDTESVPANKAKKQNIVTTLLRNLHAPLGGSGRVIAGAGNLTYAPIDISAKANQFRSERGWFGDAATTFGDLPTRKQTFAGVPFDVYDFPTSPVPNAVMLSGPNVPGNLPDAVRGIAVNKRASALFFLQTARIDKRRNEREIRDKKTYELARYVVHYADGQTETVPIVAEGSVDNYKQDASLPPRALPGAQIAWTKAYANGTERAVAYVQQWDNPRPDVAIASVDLEYGQGERRGVPVLLALTAASKGPSK